MGGITAFNYLDQNSPMFQNNLLYSKLMNIGGGMSAGNPYLAALQMGLGAAGGLIDTPEKKHGRWKAGMAKDVGDDIRWNRLNKKAVTPQMIQSILGLTRESMAPLRGDMLWRAQQRGGGQGSRQTEGMYLRNYLPIAAGQSADLQKWGVGMNQQREMQLLNLLRGFTT